MAALKPLERITIFAAACVTLQQLSGPSMWTPNKTGGITSSPQMEQLNQHGGLTTRAKLFCKYLESTKLHVLRRNLADYPWMISYFQLGSEERDLTKWRAADVGPDNIVMCPAVLIKKWRSGAISTPEAKSIWKGILKQTQPEFKQWLILMLRGTLTQELGGQVATMKWYRVPKSAEEDKRPQRVRDAINLGLKPIGRAMSVVTGSHKGQPLEFIAPDGRWGVLDLSCKSNDKPYWFAPGESYSLFEMEKKYA